MPEIGRWASRDPIGEKGGRNLYRFVVNTPCGKVDALGKQPGVIPGEWGEWTAWDTYDATHERIRERERRVNDPSTYGEEYTVRNDSFRYSWDSVACTCSKTAIDVVKRDRKDWYHIETETHTQTQNPIYRYIYKLTDAGGNIQDGMEILSELSWGTVVRTSLASLAGTVVLTAMERTETFGGWGNDSYGAEQGQANSP